MDRNEQEHQLISNGTGNPPGKRDGYKVANEQPTDQPINASDLFGGIQERINQANPGQYGEGKISAAKREFSILEDLVKNGQLSQKDFVTVGSQFRDFVKPTISHIMNSGQRAAQAGESAGAYDLIWNGFKNLDIYKSAQETLGRDLTSNEFAAFVPYFGQGTQKEVDAGRAALAQFAEQQKNSPQGLDQKYQQGAEGYNSQVQGVYNDLLKRGASKEEMDHFGKLIASGEVDAYTLRQFVSQLPEYREKEDAAMAAKRTEEDAAARTQLGQELGQYDQDFFSKAKENVISRYAKAGTLNSPSLDFALTNLMGDIQKQRSAYLADVARRDYESNRGFGREDYLQNKGLLREDYTNNLDQMFGNQAYGRQRSDQLSDLLRGRSYEVADYTTQRQDLMSLLNQQQGRRRGGLGGALGPLIGAGVGAVGAGMVTGGMGAGAGAQLGAQLGGAGGGAYDYLNY